MSKVCLIEDMSMQQYHICLSRNMIKNACAAIIPGSPERAELIASKLENPVKLASHRGLDSWLGKLGKHDVLVTNTGMGGPTTEIVLQELIGLGINTFLRIGTTGAIQPEILPGSLVISEAAIRLDGTSDHYAPPCYPAVADIDMVLELRLAAKELLMDCYSGITVSSATFFPGQERYDSASGYVQRSFRDSLLEWQQLGALNYEMESGTLFTICRTMGLKAAAICAVVANRVQSEAVVRDVIKNAEEKATETGLLALLRILNK